MSAARAIDPGCPFCKDAGGTLLWRDGFCRVVLAPEPDHPGFCRVVLEQHAREMTDLPAPDRARLMRVVFAVEETLREALAPDKINLASLGNVVPHLHWHVIPRFRDDRHFPAPIWATPARSAPDRPSPDPARLAMLLAARL